MSINNPLTPPDHYIEWATDPGADKAEPSFGRKLVGFFSGQTTNFNSELNYILNLATRWSQFNSEVNAAEIAYQNVEYYPSPGPFGTATLDAIHIVYDPLADRWYCTTAETTTAGDIRVYDSPDGVTWSAAKIISAANDENCTPCWSDGTNVGVAIEDEFFLSTDLTSTNIPTIATGTFADIERCRDLIYDETNSRWFACGTDAGLLSGYIESSADGITWVQELLVADPFISLAGDRQGNAVASTDDNNSNYYSGTMQGGWNTTTTDPTADLTQLEWSPSLGLFVGFDTSHTLWTSEDGNHWHNTDMDFQGFYITPSFVLCEGDTGTQTVEGRAYAFSGPALDRTSFNLEDYGVWARRVSEQTGFNNSFIGGQGKAIWIYNTSSNLLAVARYGPDSE